MVTHYTDLKNYILICESCILIHLDYKSEELYTKSLMKQQLVKSYVINNKKS